MKRRLYLPIIFMICLLLVGCHTAKQQSPLGDIYTDASSGTLSFSLKEPELSSSKLSSSKKEKTDSSKSKKAKSSTKKHSSEKEKAKKSITVKSS